MKKQRIAAMMAGVVVITAIPGAVMAEEPGQGMPHGRMMHGKKDMSEKKDMMKDMPMMPGRMTGGMMQRHVVASGDGGVIIVVGNLLLKYNEDLELVKKTTIEIREEDKQQMMRKMKARCDMCRKRMEKTGTKEDE